MSLERTHLKKEDYDDYDEQIISKCNFDQSLFCDFYDVDDHWQVILALKYVAPYRFISKKSLQTAS